MVRVDKIFREVVMLQAGSPPLCCNLKSRLIGAWLRCGLCQASNKGAVYVLLALNAAALYYLAELVEEFTNLTSKIIRIIIWITTVLYILLALFENLPTSVLVLGFISQLLHLSLLTHFPFFYLSSPPFIAAVGVFIAQHYFAFSYFNSTYHPASEVLAYFTLCVWLVPFGFFLSLSANENILPTRAESTPLLNSSELVLSRLLGVATRLVMLYWPVHI
ncbi:Transmembrane adaptor Erv26 [Trinorchestia longiramus]|nr:Transmembrane adaptor Erv26 [Trinorchestia longiramus]